MEEKKIVIQGMVLAYTEIWARSVLPAVVFLHGWRSNRTVWYPIMAKFQKGKRRLIALDLPGFGNSEYPQNPFSISDYVNVVVEFMRKMKMDKVHLVGHSFGGRIALKLAATGSFRLSTLTLVDSAGIRDPSLTRFLLGFGAKIVKPFFRIGPMRQIRLNIYKKMGEEDYIATPRLLQTYLRVVGEDLSLYLSRINIPTFLYWGKDDKETPLSMGLRMKEKIKNSHLLIAAGGHFAFLENIESFSEPYTKFIKKNE
ncbi:alpha/beta hydrolase [Candidatus Gottesmanbacteria bacterium]|nr:alpha/beta hydrolase [Candidatus Gottesmanbacteria bacterium]